MTTAAARASSLDGTGIPNAKLGLWLFLASEAMLFATLFTSYIVLRSAAPVWPRPGEALNVPLGAVNTLVLLISSAAMALAAARARARDLKGFRLYLIAATVLGVVFLAIKGTEYAAKFHAGHFPSTNVFYAVYFTLTGLHALHLAGGIAANALLLGWSGRSGWDDPLFTGRVECAALYWHFVDMVWLLLFASLYLI